MGKVHVHIADKRTLTELINRRHFTRWNHKLWSNSKLLWTW